MRTVEVGETVTLDATTYDVIGGMGGAVRLRDTFTGQVTEVAGMELAQHLPATAGADPRERLQPSILDSLTKSQRATLRFWREHIEELLSGSHPRLGDRPDYALDRPVESRVLAKVAELKLQGVRGGSRAALYRKMGEYERSGPLGLVDARWLRTYGHFSNVDELALEALLEARAQLKGKSTRTKSAVITEMRRQLVRDHGTDCMAPSDASIYRYLKTMDGDYLHRDAKAHRTNANRPTRHLAKNAQRTPGAQMQMDSTPWDIFVRHNGKVVRVTLTILFDVASRSIVGFDIVPNAATGADHSATVVRAIAPDEVLPSNADLRQAIRSTLPKGITLHSDEVLGHIQNARPWVYPRTITIDNGADFRSDVFLSTMQQLGIDVRMAAPGTPTDKAGVERMFRSINTMFLQHLPGYAGRSPQHRGKDIDQEELLNLYALRELFDEWRRVVWQNRPHRALVDNPVDSQPMSPNAYLRRAAEVTSTLNLGLTKAEYIALMPSQYRRVQATGVQIGNRIYDSPDLQPLRGARSEIASKKGKWETKIDPHNPLVIWVHGPSDWIECFDRNASMINQPFADTYSRSAVTDTNVPNDVPNPPAAPAKTLKGTLVITDHIQRVPLEWETPIEMTTFSTQEYRP